MANSIFVTPGSVAFSGSSVTFPLATQLTETALGTLAMVSSAATNQLQIPNGSNLEYGQNGWASNVFAVGSIANGGTSRNTVLMSAANINFAPNGGGAGAATWQISTGSNLLALTDNTNDIGASGATRPRNIFAGTRVTAPAYTVGSTVGASGTGTVLTQLTVVNGIVTAITIS